MKAVAVVSLAFLLIGCVSGPEQAVDLSITIGEDLSVVEQSHLVLLNEYFRLMENDINRFVDEKYTPFIVKHTIDQFELIDKLEAEQPTGQLALMQVFVEEVTQDIARYRSELLKPLRERQSEMTQTIRASYSALHYANVELTGYLDSVHRVTREQTRFLRSVGLDDLRKRTTDTIVELTRAVEEHLERAETAEASVAEFTALIERLRAGANPGERE